MVLLALQLVLVAGCVGEPLLHRVHIAGVHHRWDPDGNLTITASLIHIGDTALPDRGRTPTVKVFVAVMWREYANGTGKPPSANGVLNEGTFEFQGAWPPGKYETVSMSQPAAKEKDRYYNVYLRTSVRDQLESATYVSECFSRADASRSDICASNYNVHGLTLWESAEEWDARTIACCKWLPPGLDIVDLACDAGVARASCEATLYNWRDENRTPVMAYRVLQIDLVGTESVVAQGTIPTADAAIKPGAFQSVRFELEGTAALGDTPALRREVEISVDTQTEHEGEVTKRTLVGP